MRPIKFGPFSPITALTTAFNAQGFNSTGAATAPTTSATTDGLAHQVTLLAPVQATLVGVTFTIVGTAADNNAQTETGLVGPASGATVTSTKYFKTVSTITPSATMGALTVAVGIAAPSLSSSLVLSEEQLAAANLTITMTGTVNVTVNDTIGNVWDVAPSTLPWGAITALTSKAVTTDGSARASATAVQVLTNSVTNGATYTLWVGQATRS
jgi:hypothetical protein